MSGIYVYTGVIGFLFGVAFASFIAAPVVVLVVCGTLGCALLCIGVFSKKKPLILTGLFCTATVLGLVRAQHSFLQTESFLDTLRGQTTIEGVVTAEPSFSEKSQKVIVLVRQDDKKERVLLITPLYPEFVYGDTLRVSGELKRPEAFMTDTGTMFDYPAYLAKDGVTYEMMYPTAEVVSRDGGDIVHQFLYTWRRKFIETLHTYLPEPHATLAGGISIGAQDGMDADTEDMFRRVGLIHIVVLSGYNITVVADTVMRMTAFLPRALMLSSGGLVVVLFTIMTGASATAVRASVMALLAMLARLAGETYDISRALALAAAGMVFVNPRILLSDPSFQLSFLATFGLIHLSPILEKVFIRLPTLFSLRQTIASTLATQAFVVPLLVLKTGQVSIISLVANVLVLPTVPISMFFSVMLGVFGGLSPVVGIGASFPATFVLAYILRVAEALSRVPFASVSVGVPSVVIVGVVYAGLLGCIYGTKNRNKNIKTQNKF